MNNKFPASLGLICLIIIILINLWSQNELRKEISLYRAKEEQKILELEGKIDAIYIPEVVVATTTCNEVNINDLDPEKYALFIRVIGSAIRSEPEGWKALADYWATHFDGELTEADKAILREFLPNPEILDNNP